MPNYIQIADIAKSYGDRLLMSDVTFSIDQGDKIALIAKNGAGKTTLMRIIAGLESPDSGTILRMPGLRVGYLDQKSEFISGQTPLEACLDGENGWEKEMQAKQLLTQLGVHDIETGDVDNLSGGQRKRLAIARLLLSEPDLLLFDEPTNHLDIPTIVWLENYLRRSKMTLLLVTHDRYFLDNVCNTILELDRCQVYSHKGNFEYYLRRRQERIEAMSAELDKVRNTLRRETEWMRRQPQARGSKARYRIDQYYDLKDRASVSLNEKTINLDTKASYIGSKIFEAKDVSKRYGDKVILDSFSYTFARYDRVGIVGPNGVGKSTFIKMLMGLEPSDSGKWDVGETVRFGYYSQEGISFDENQQVIEAVSRIADDILLSDGVHSSPMQWLQRFLFSPPEQQKYIRTLSGGEKARLHLATVLMRQPNFLVLDEPTNDLDIVTLGLLSDWLESFRGCLIVVSHDRYFLDTIADHLFVMEGDGIVRDFPGGYTDYIKSRDANSSAKTKESNKPQNQKPRRVQERPRRMTYAERKEYEALTAEIEQLQAQVDELDLLFASGEVIEDATAVAERYATLKSDLDEKELRWLELDELAN